MNPIPRAPVSCPLSLTSSRCFGGLSHREGRAEKITELSGNPKAHMEALTKDSDTKVRPEFSFEAIAMFGKEGWVKRGLAVPHIVSTSPYVEMLPWHIPRESIVGKDVDNGSQR